MRTPPNYPRSSARRCGRRRPRPAPRSSTACRWTTPNSAPRRELGARPTLRYDPAYTPIERADPEFRSAYDDLGAELERVCRTAVLDPGQLLLVDNDVVVHGRVPFTPRYDGTDRWIKRVNIRLPRHRD